MDGPSVLQRRLQLRDVVDASSLQAVCETFARLYGVSLKLFEAEGAKVVDAKADTGLCAYVFAFPRGRALCTRLVGEIKVYDAAPQPCSEVRCFTGCSYKIAPLVYDHEQLGKLVVGPYFPAALEGLPEELVQLDPRIERPLLEQYAARYRRLGEEDVTRIVDSVVRILDVLVFTGHKSHMAQATHLEAMSDSWRELSEKNERLQESLDRLKELDRLKSNFLATVSHELRTPLTSVIGYSEMLLDGLAGDLSGEQREYVQTIMEKGETLLSMISSVLDVSKIEQGQLRLAYEDVDFTKVVEEAVRAVRPLAVRRRQRLEWFTAEGLPRARIDREKVLQVLLNLLGNALKFTPEGGSVHLVADLAPMPGAASDAAASLFALHGGQALRVRVEDTGIGIAADRQERIFDVFYQVDGSSTREYGGCGLGLSIVKSYVEAHQGRVAVDSELGRGSTFTIYLPLEPSGQ